MVWHKMKWFRVCFGQRPVSAWSAGELVIGEKRRHRQQSGLKVGRLLFVWWLSAKRTITGSFSDRIGSDRMQSARGRVLSEQDQSRVEQSRVEQWTASLGCCSMAVMQFGYEVYSQQAVKTPKTVNTEKSIGKKDRAADQNRWQENAVQFSSVSV